MSKQLSEEKINALFAFVNSKNVKYKDVQFEIVDHLASAIEDKQNTDSSISFESALNQIYSKFPITGFALMILAKESELKKFWLKKFLTFMLNYLKLPKIIISGILVYLFHLILNSGFIINPRLLLLGLVLITTGCAGYRYKYGFEFNKGFREKYLVTSKYLTFYGGFGMIWLYLPFDLALSSTPDSIYFSGISNWILSIYITLILLWTHAYTFEFPKILQKELEEKYKHLNIKLA